MTFRQTITLSAIFAGFAVHAQAAFFIADGDLNAGKLHSNGMQSNWTPNSLISPQNTDHSQIDLATNILKELMPTISNESGGFAIYFSRENRFEFFLESINGPIGWFYGSGLWSQGSVNSSTPNTPWHPEFKRPVSPGAWVLVNHLGQLFYIGKPFTLMGSHKNDTPSVIEGNVPLISFGNNHAPIIMHAPDENQATPQSISVPEPASLALLLLGLLAVAIILLQLEKTLLLCLSAEPFNHKAESKSRFSSAKLLRRDARNKILLFKFLQQRKYTIL
ncbi:MAG: PEP-CTERM sorting domain-containing protein [Methylomonas sp.]